MELKKSHNRVLGHLATTDEPLCLFRLKYWTLPSMGPFTQTQPWDWGSVWTAREKTIQELFSAGFIEQTPYSMNYDAEIYPERRDYVLTPLGLKAAQTIPRTWNS